MFVLKLPDRTIKFRSISDSFDNPYRKNVEKKNYVLPSINTKYSVSEKANIRFAASQTITRPVLMEVLPIQFVNPDGTVETGNGDLQDTKKRKCRFKIRILLRQKRYGCCCCLW